MAILHRYFGCVFCFGRRPRTSNKTKKRAIKGEKRAIKGEKRAPSRWPLVSKEADPFAEFVLLPIVGNGFARGSRGGRERGRERESESQSESAREQ